MSDITYSTDLKLIRRLFGFWIELLARFSGSLAPSLACLLAGAADELRDVLASTVAGGLAGARNDFELNGILS